VQIVGSTPHPDEMFMAQAGRTMTTTDEKAVAGCRVLICDRDQKWSAPFRRMLEESEVRVVQTPFEAPNYNAHAERFVRSIKDECLNRVIPMRERHFRRALHEFVEHYLCSAKTPSQENGPDFRPAPLNWSWLFCHSSVVAIFQRRPKAIPSSCLAST
jgi:putative transposase